METITFINGHHLLDDSPEEFEESEKIEEEQPAVHKGGEILNEIVEEEE